MHNPSDSPPVIPPVDPAACRTTLLRAAADDELSPAQTSELAIHLAAAPGDFSVIQFERRLRSELAGSAEVRTAPESLRRRIEAMRASINAPRPTLRRPSTRVAWALLAASLALLASGYLILARWPSQLPGQGEIVNAAHRVALTRFLAWQHADCEIHVDSIKKRFDIGPASAAPAMLAKIVQRQPDLGPLQSGFSPDGTIEYLGAARCAVPGRGESVHIVLGFRTQTSDSTSHRRLISLFVQEDHNELSLEPGRTYNMQPRAGDWDGRNMRVCVWRNNGLVYFLVGTSPEVLEAARLGIGAEPASGDI